MSMDRRQFLIRSGQIGVAAALAGYVAFDRLGGSAPAAPRMHKCISLGGPGPLERGDHPDDYRLWGNREYIRASGTSWVKLWVAWSSLQQELGIAPINRAASWNHLNTAPGGASWLHRLDAQVRAANDDDVRVLLAVYHTHPTWSSGAGGPDPVNGGRPAEQKLPSDLSVNGPWAWFISHLLARYRAGAPANPTGPHEGPAAGGGDPRFGNPVGAHVDAFEICNEPNLLYWPQEGIAKSTAEMIVTATALSRDWGSTPIVAPATSDFPDELRRSDKGITATAWDDFTRQLLVALGDFRPAVPVHWSQHNYRDVRPGGHPSRAQQVIAMLREKEWPGSGQRLWLTEGGLDLGTKAGDLAQQQAQARSIESNFRRMRRVPDIYMWTQHTINDKQGNGFKTGLRDDFIWEKGPGPPRPAWRTWRKLPGPRTAGSAPR